LARFWRHCALAAACFLGGGCAKITKVRTVCLRTDITQAANQNQPVAVDVLLVRDKDLIKKLMTLTAADWFEKRAQFMRDYPDPKDLTVYHHEWVPNQKIPCSSLALKPMPRVMIVFANYFSKGDHRARLPNGNSATIRLMDDDFEILKAADCTRTSCPVETP
jgi:type VI secretion system protein